MDPLTLFIVVGLVMCYLAVGLGVARSRAEEIYDVRQTAIKHWSSYGSNTVEPHRMKWVRGAVRARIAKYVFLWPFVFPVQWIHSKLNTDNGLIVAFVLKPIQEKKLEYQEAEEALAFWKGQLRVTLPDDPMYMAIRTTIKVHKNRVEELEKFK